MVFHSSVLYCVLGGGCLSYHLDDVIVGTISFLLVRIKLRQMELAIVRSELTDNAAAGLSVCLSCLSHAWCCY